MRVIRAAALGIWLGGMIAFAFLFAPIAFMSLGPTPVFAAMIATTLMALTRFGFACAGITMIATLFIRGKESARRWISILCASSIAALAGMLELSVIIPRMQVTPLATPAYEALHHQSSAIYAVALIATAAAFAVAVAEESVVPRS